MGVQGGDATGSCALEAVEYVCTYAYLELVYLVLQGVDISFTLPVTLL